MATPFRYGGRYSRAKTSTQPTHLASETLPDELAIWHIDKRRLGFTSLIDEERVPVLAMGFGLQRGTSAIGKGARNYCAQLCWS
jgi:hypothetical protein